MPIFNFNSRKYIVIGAVSLIFCITLLSFSSIQTSSGFIEEIESTESDYTIENKIGEAKFSVRYFPPAYLALKQTKRADSKGNFKSLRKDFNETLDFGLRIDLPNQTNGLKKVSEENGNYQALVNYLAFEIQKDLKLKIKDQHYMCSFVHFERNYDTAPYLQIQFGFNKTEDVVENLASNENVSVKFDAYHFDLGPIYFQYDNKVIRNCPTLIL